MHNIQGLFILGVSTMGAYYSGYVTNPQDIAPNFAGAITLKKKLSYKNLPI